MREEGVLPAHPRCILTDMFPTKNQSITWKLDQDERKVSSQLGCPNTKYRLATWTKTNRVIS